MISALSRLRLLAAPSERLSNRIVHATFWASMTRAGRLLLLVRTLVVARLLAPHDLGLMGVALVALAFTDLTAQTGFRIALIQKKGDIKPYLDTAWTMEVLRGLILGGAMFAAAPLIAAFFRAPEAEPLIRILSIDPILRSAFNIGIVYFRKDLQLHKRFIFELANFAVAAGVTIILAFVLRNVWALVYGTLAGSAAQLIASFMLHPHRPRPRLELSKARELWRFGRWVFATNLLTYMLQNVDKLFVGRMLGVASLGFYQLAFRLSTYVGTELKDVGRSVTLPVYAKLQDEQGTLRRAYLGATQFTSLTSFPIALGLIVIGSHLVPAVLGGKWLPMVPAMQVLAIAGLLSTLEAVGSSQLFRGIGQPYLNTRLQLIKLVVLLALIYPLTAAQGPVGVALSVALSSLVIFPISLGLAGRVLGCSAITQLKVLLIPGVSSLIMASAVMAFKASLAAEPNIFNLALLIGLGVVVYLTAVLILDWIMGHGIVRTLRYRLALSPGTG